MLVSLGALGAVAGSVALWPSEASKSGYPLARRITGSRVSVLWQMPPEKLQKLMSDDVARLTHAIERLEWGSDQTQKASTLLSREKIEELSPADRNQIRNIWWSVFEPMLVLDELKHRYEAWWGVDFLKQPRLHAGAFGLCFAALCAQVRVGVDFLTLVSKHKLAQTLFDEKMDELGVPRGTFGKFRSELSRTRDLAAVPVGAHWYDRWIESHLDASDPLRKVIGTWRSRALERLGLQTSALSVSNDVETLKAWAFRRWFPVQESAATWFGDTRVAPQERRLISDAQIAVLKAQLRPGDIILERRNWYLSNIGLPGFWPHAALHVGTQQALIEAFDQDPDVQGRYGKLSEHLAKKHPKAWEALGSKDAQGHGRPVVEAVSEGVTATSVEHTCGADYVAVLRPRFPPLEIARAIDQALGYFGRPYDFNFDFATDDAVVCSELVMKAYEPEATEAPGLRIPYVALAGRRAVPPTEIVRTFATELGAENRQLDFVYFLDGIESTHSAKVSDSGTLAKSIKRPKWDLIQP
jgi:hypothetical protein